MDKEQEGHSGSLLESEAVSEPGSAVVSLPEPINDVPPKISLVDTLPEESVAELCALFGCTREALGVILAATSGNPTHIISLIQTLSPAYLAIKLRFETRKRAELGGAACIIARGNTGEIMDQTLWVTSKELPDSFDIAADWESVRKGIQSFGNNPDRALFPKISKLLRDVFSPTAVNTLYKTSSAKDGLVASLEKTFASLHHNEVVFEMKTEKFNKARLEMAGFGETKEPPVSETSTETPHARAIGTVQIHCKPLLDPVKGKAVSELVHGDLLVVEIEKTGGLSSIITKILDRAGEQPIFPVTSVDKLPSGQSLIRLAVSKGIEGVALINADLRLKTAPRFSLGIAENQISGILKKIFFGIIVFMGVLAIFYWLF